MSFCRAQGGILTEPIRDRSPEVLKTVVDAPEKEFGSACSRTMLAHWVDAACFRLEGSRR